MNKNFSQTKMLVLKNLWSKKFLIKKIKVQKIFYPIKIGSIKFGFKIIKVPNQFWVQKKFWFEKI